MAGVGGVATGHKVASHSVWVFYRSIPHHGGGSRAEHGVVEGLMGGAQANPFCFLYSVWGSGVGMGGGGAPYRLKMRQFKAIK